MHTGSGPSPYYAALGQKQAKLRSRIDTLKAVPSQYRNGVFNEMLQELEMALRDLR